MMTLFFFGRQMEQFLGLGRYLAFYMLSGTGAAAAQVASCGQRQASTQCLGASGGVYAQIACVTCIMPTMTVYLYMLLPVPLWVLTCGLVSLDVFYPKQGQANISHVFGAGSGVMLW
eukprot:CAMPEP_0170586120 /NCGR_PEP_ID=MMETSP0224-20130122/9578_1 /TAXON_ID=285029 /ORGANISM="Togula jolla, Strain CCCM 725" /LENGTH=116 /DNA_ID=CAMNT_0010909651 /DNA_START=288 /DNA_END=635 /DNA_ORIENTATION=-